MRMGTRGRAVGAVVAVGDLAEVVPVARAGLVAPAAQAQPAQLATGACAGGLFGAVEPLAVADLGGLPGGAVGGAGDGEGAAPWAVEAPPLMRGADAATDVDICLLYTSPSPRDQRGSRMPSSA